MSEQDECEVIEYALADEPITSEEAELGARFLKALTTVWDRHLLSLPKIASILCYMDNYFIEHPQEKCRPLMQDGPSQFYKKILLADGEWIKDRLIKSVLGQFEHERRGELGNRGIVKGAVSMLLLIEEGAYETLLEKPFLSDTAKFYNAEFSRLMETSSSREVLAKIDQRLTEETERCTNCLSQTTLPKALHVIHENLLRFSTPLIENTESGIKHMLDSNDIPVILLMFRLFKGAESEATMALMRLKFKEYYYARGQAIVPCAAVSKGNRAGPASSWVKSVLELKKSWDRVYAEGLNSDRAFQAAVTEGFASFINKFPNSAEFISLFLDDQMRAVTAGKIENSDQAQSDVISLFRFLQDKDMFEAFYRTHLAKRILMGSRTELLAEDAERAMLHKLRLECGFQFTTKLEGMFKDLATASDIAQAFKQEGTFSNGSFDLNVTVLTSSVWPIRTPAPCILSPDALKAVNAYTEFYTTRHSGRKLMWINNIGTCDIRAHFGSKRFELITNTYQMIILLLFNTNDALSYNELKAQTGLQDYELRRHLFSLSGARYTLLLKSSPGKEVLPDDIFRWNSEFRAPAIKIKLPTPLTRLDADIVNQGAKEDEETMTRGEVEASRGHLVEAAIVRVMKTRRRLAHARLVAEVTSHLQIRFQPDPALIKKKIEALIDREFLERIDGDM
ncbi:hypothetical protein DSO57_1010715 [Entomophthora muscae]|uniref:Uncharacterized protein n=1 Tax=Entomophthora muscae TaxID=34485 RepID=A0ACC2U513_9FUNG|nr:hypothetical protein DSO57_1010715 [Entomophthora muscae]